MKTDNNIAQNSKQFCIWCGNEIKPGSKFCPKCGKKQIEQVEEQIEGRFMNTHHYFVFAVIDGEYYVVDDFIQSVGHSG